jgi:hypothetical protein
VRKSDVETHYDGRTRRPAVNVKHHLWIPDLVRKYKGQGNHEFSDDAGFWAWVEERYEAQDHDNELDGPDEWARESCWELAQETADEVWDHLPWRYGDKRETHPVKVWSEGRSGGWCVVEGLPDIDEWDAVALAKWAKFEKIVKQIAHEEYPYQYVWNLEVNVWERVRDERQNQYPTPANVEVTP